jgi:hypothetical protein
MPERPADQADYFTEPAEGIVVTPPPAGLEGAERARIPDLIAMAKANRKLSHGSPRTDEEVALAVDRDWLGHPRPDAGVVDGVE